ncbi:hypothetical protein P781_16190 [Vibrio mimicus CAIM 1883]|nr:hypothetical protein P781_16190 [Vibrio mimicus CAIM 1883]
MSSVPESKDELLTAINSIFPKLMDDYRSVPASMARKCEIEGNVKGTQISVCDTVAYLVGWGNLVLKWHSFKSQGLPVDFPDTVINGISLDCWRSVFTISIVIGNTRTYSRS